MSGSTTIATAGSRRSASPTTRSPAPRNISSSAANIARGEHWGYEVRGAGRHASEGASRSYEAWQKAGVSRADGQPFPQPNATAKLWAPVPGGPAFLLGPNFYAVRSYNPSMNYTLVDRASRRPHRGRRAVRAALPRRRAHARRWPKCRKSSSA